jgi:hypothetical protein
MSLAGARLLARWCPAFRRREPGLRLLHGTWEGGWRYFLPAAEVDGGRVRGSASTADTGDVEYRRGTALADRLVVVGKPR